jgi:hypothetical protein
MDILVGYTGFVGSNIALQHKFEGLYNSKNINEAFENDVDLCIYSGIRAEKFLANKEPNSDMEIIQNAIENIKKINPKKLVLISTIDVFMNPNGADEDKIVKTEGLHAYGYNRFLLEQWCSQNIENCSIIRLPGLFGQNIKKNFIYDMINFLPAMLNEEKYFELTNQEPFLIKHYIKQDNGFYKCYFKTPQEGQILKDVFKRLKFSALNFTDSRASFQFYNLAYLWKHIQVAIKCNIPLLHLAVEPVSVNEIYQIVNNCDFTNEIMKTPPKYDFRTKYEKLFGGENGYIFNKEKVLNDIDNFMREVSKP